MIQEEIDNIIKNYEWGIHPDSVRVLTISLEKEEGELELKLLEGITIQILLNADGFKITQANPPNLANVGHTYETIDALLLNTSPLFAQKHSDKLFEKLCERGLFSKSRE
ncbi:uncharacterized protein VTP21DRAFT_9338 [Calcarisporiella thermophila]|uniref:uncharacterized protein n=1 Tax=Calcarisporiella thermophila TaxID=911321 RepID=UPI0037423993